MLPVVLYNVEDVLGEHRKEITELLGAAGAGDRAALDRVTSLVYDELRRLAHFHMRGERPDHTLHPTALVHEAFLRLVGSPEISYQDRRHFYAIASLTMRRVLVNWARDRSRQKRRGDAVHAPLEGSGEPFSTADPETVLAVDTALGRLAEVSDRATRVVECRYFGGLTIEETADALDISAATVKREWMMARAWLRRELG